jgi:hypothetical protein
LAEILLILDRLCFVIPKAKKLLVCKNDVVKKRNT